MKKIEIINYELSYLEAFLPKYLNNKDSENLIKKNITEKSLEKKDFGKLMSILKSNHSDEIDLSLASKIVNTLLN